MPVFGFCQSSIDDVLRFDEYLAYVKTHHPVVKQANLIITKPVPSYAYLPYAFGTNWIHQVLINGQ